MKYLKNIPPEWIEEMRRYDIRPNDPYFFLVEMLAETGFSVKDVVAAIGERFEALPRDLRDVSNVARGEVQAIGDTAIATVKKIYDGTDEEPGVLARLSASALKVTDSTILMHQSVGEVKGFIEALSTALKDTKVVVERRRYFGFKTWVTVLAFAFSLVFAAIGYWQFYRLQRVVATRNAPAIVQAFAEAFSHHPLPTGSLSDPFDSPKDIEAFAHGIGQMPPQLAFALGSAVGIVGRGSPAELAELKAEIERYKQTAAYRAGAQLVLLRDGSWAVRVTDDSRGYFPLPGYAGQYARAYADLAP